MTWEWVGNCLICDGRIYQNTETGEVDRSDCICDHITKCGYPEFFNECHNAVGEKGCYGEPNKQHPKCPAAIVEQREGDFHEGRC